MKMYLSIGKFLSCFYNKEFPMTSTASFPVKIKHSQLTLSARQSLSGNWGIAIAGFLLAIAISLLAGIIPLLGGVLIGGPLTIGMSRFALELSRKKHSEIEKIFSGFNQFAAGLIAYLLYSIAVTAGFIFFIIPGFIALAGFSQTFYILADNPKLDGVDALRESWEMMDGHKGAYLLFLLRFIGWFFLSILTLFIGLLWLYPYMQVSFAKFHDMVRTGGHPDDLDEGISKHLVDKDLV